jgi:hypothetical protein
VFEAAGASFHPKAYQARALEALERTREEGNTAGLVVLATGVGKTWLSAFDSNRPPFRRVLFVAHREEILGQAWRTFRRIRPLATLGYYNGREKAPEADVLFASIQTLSRRRHLHRFDPRQFDYLVLDEFHHAAARSYRRLIGYFEPRFLLGLTATPERTDGADLLTLCGDNLVYRADMAEGIKRGLLCPFEYYGVPDEVDYANIPWRSRRFDEEALTVAVATRARAENALEQLRKHGKDRTVAFCVSQRHADFMAAFFREQGLRAVAVHAGPTSAPRARSLERLEAGELDAQDILRSLLRSIPAGEQLEEYYRDFREMRGTRPLAGEAFLDGFNPRTTRRTGHGSWLDFVQAMGDLDPEQKKVREHLGAFLEQLEVTPMTRSYKMLVLQAMVGEDAFPGSICLDRLGERFGDFARRYSSLRTEVGEALEDPGRMRQLLADNPIAAWVGGAGTGGTSYFRFEDDTFSTTFTVPDELREATQDLVEELVEWRLGEYLQRSAVARGPDRFVCRVSHAGGRPILFLPDRERTPGLPEGWRDVWVEEVLHQAKFVKVALNVVTRPGSDENLLPDILRRWFGPQAGHPGRSHAVLFEMSGGAYRMKVVEGEGPP